MKKSYIKRFLSQTQVVSVVLITGVALILAGTAYYWGTPLIQKTQKNIEIENSENFMMSLASAIEEVAQTGNSKILDFKSQGKFEILPDKDEIIYQVQSPTLSYATSTYIPLNDMPPFKIKVVVMKCNQNVIVPYLNKTPTSVCYAKLDCSTANITFDTSACDVSKEEYSNGEIVTSPKNKESYEVVTSFVKNYNIAYLQDLKEEKIPGLKGENHNIVLLAKTQPYNKEMFLNTFRIVSREIVDEKTLNGYYIDIVGNKQIIEKGKETKISISRGESEIKAGESALGGNLNIIKIKIETY